MINWRENTWFLHFTLKYFFTFKKKSFLPFFRFLPKNIVFALIEEKISRSESREFTRSESGQINRRRERPNEWIMIFLKIKYMGICFNALLHGFRLALDAAAFSIFTTLMLSSRVLSIRFVFSNTKFKARKPENVEGL